MESLFAYDDDLVTTLGSLCGHFWDLKAALGTLSVTLGLLWKHLRHIWVPLGSLRGDFGVSLGSVWDQFGNILRSFQFFFFPRGLGGASRDKKFEGLAGNVVFLKLLGGCMRGKRRRIRRALAEPSSVWDPSFA